MFQQSKEHNVGIISRFTDQPAAMPAELRDKIEARWNGEPVQLYALADLDASLRLSHTWVALGPKHLAIARDGKDAIQSGIDLIDRSCVKAIKEVPSLSCTTLGLMGEPDQPALAVLRYTHRQRRAMENIKFVLEQQIAGNEVIPEKPDEIYSASVAKPIHEAQVLVAHKLSVLARLIDYLKPYWRRVVFGTIAAVLMTILSLVPPHLTGKLIDHVVSPFDAGTLSREAAMGEAWRMIAILAGVFLLLEGLRWVRLRSMAMLGEYVARDLRHDLYHHIQKLSLSFFSSRQTGSIIARVSSDTDRLWDFIAFGIVEVSLSAITLVGLGAVLLTKDWRLGLVVTLPVPLLLWSFFQHGRGMKRIFLRAWRKWSRLTDVLADTIPGMRVVKAFNREKYETQRFDDRNISATDEFLKIHAVWTRFWPLMLLGFSAMTLVVWAVALPRVLSNAGGPFSKLSVGTFVEFMMYMGMFFGPLQTIGMMARMVNRAVSSAHRVFEILDTQPEITEITEPIRLEPVKGRVTFENVGFAYDTVRYVIRGISFQVEPGEMIGLVGPSGAGKTTIINLIVRFYDVSSGRILIDGVDLRDVDLGHYRRQVGMVSQDPHLFHGSIVDNIRYGNLDAPLEQVIEAARMANAHDFICRLPHGYDTMVGERGHTLSGGERQRVSIARAVLKNPHILILDEATSSVDTETERKIQEALERLVVGRTVFAIAHRLSTLRHATRLFVIEDGKITEQGTHEELLANKEGTYTKLHNMQQELHQIYAV
jgi:ATP-binding cassette subfamily B protein